MPSAKKLAQKIAGICMGEAEMGQTNIVVKSAEFPQIKKPVFAGEVMVELIAAGFEVKQGLPGDDFELSWAKP